jgi:hypothetical protein
MPKKPRQTQHQPTAVEHFQDWLAKECAVSREDIPLVVERVMEFSAKASVLVGFPIATGATAAQERSAFRLHLIWPSVVPASERASHEGALSESFRRDVQTPLAVAVSCDLGFSVMSPQTQEEYPCWLGPNPRGYEAFSARFVAMKRTLDGSPEITQELNAIIRSVRKGTVTRQHRLAARLGSLVTRLRSA